jgi:hypothetical protein
MQIEDPTPNLQCVREKLEVEQLLALPWAAQVASEVGLCVCVCVCAMCMCAYLCLQCVCECVHMMVCVLACSDLGIECHLEALCCTTIE